MHVIAICKICYIYYRALLNDKLEGSIAQMTVKTNSIERDVDDLRRQHTKLVDELADRADLNEAKVSWSAHGTMTFDSRIF